MPKRTHLKALRNLISEAAKLLATTTPPQGRSRRAHDLLTSAVALADALLKAPVDSAATLGAKGGRKTAKGRPEYFKKIAAMRKTMGGGRPRKT